MISREIVCFKIMNFFIIILFILKSFNIKIIEFSIFKPLSLLKCHFLGFHRKDLTINFLKYETKLKQKKGNLLEISQLKLEPKD